MPVRSVAGIPSASPRAGFAGCREGILSSPGVGAGRPHDSRRAGGAT